MRGAPGNLAAAFYVRWPWPEHRPSITAPAILSISGLPGCVCLCRPTWCEPCWRPSASRHGMCLKRSGAMPRSTSSKRSLWTGVPRRTTCSCRQGRDRQGACSTTCYLEAGGLVLLLGVVACDGVTGVWGAQEVIHAFIWVERVPRKRQHHQVHAEHCMLYQVDVALGRSASPWIQPCACHFCHLRRC